MLLYKFIKESFFVPVICQKFSQGVLFALYRKKVKKSLTIKKLHFY